MIYRITRFDIISYYILLTGSPLNLIIFQKSIYWVPTVTDTWIQQPWLGGIIVFIFWEKKELSKRLNKLSHIMQLQDLDPWPPSLASPAWQTGFLPLQHLGSPRTKAEVWISWIKMWCSFHLHIFSLILTWFRF